MRKPVQEKFDPAVPTLIVKYGTTKRKYRPLVRDVVVLGRSSGCDIGLVSPEVAPVHCVIIRKGREWIIRDCSGRATRVNGQPIVEGPLRDGDTITLGTFSFEAHLPAEPPPDAPAQETAAEVRHLRKSRQRIGEQALRLRTRVREMERDHNEIATRHGELAEVERRLRNSHLEHQARQQEFDKRKTELDGFAKHLRREQKKVKEQERDQAHAVEAELGEQRRELDRERKRTEQLQAEMQARIGELDEITDALELEREELNSEREQLAREREYLDQQRQELLRERQRNGDAGKETKMDAMPDRLEKARRLLSDLKSKRQKSVKSQ